MSKRHQVSSEDFVGMSLSSIWASSHGRGNSKSLEVEYDIDSQTLTFIVEDHGEVKYKGGDKEVAIDTYNWL